MGKREKTRGKKPREYFEKLTSDGPLRPPRSSRPIVLKDVTSRFGMIAVCLGPAYFIGTMGLNIIKTGVYEYTLDTY